MATLFSLFFVCVDVYIYMFCVYVYLMSFVEFNSNECIMLYCLDKKCHFCTCFTCYIFDFVEFG